MISGHWGEPVTFETQPLGQYRTIAGPEEAARALLADRPTQSGHAFMKAKKICLAVLEGRKTPDAAREAEGCQRSRHIRSRQLISRKQLLRE
ncbi:hypothetical protein NN6n1_36530 [Shinella zoogloeoides]